MSHILNTDLIQTNEFLPDANLYYYSITLNIQQVMDRVDKLHNTHI